MITIPVRIDVEDVRAELQVDDVLRRYGLKYRRSGSQYRLKECPRCHEKSSREGITIRLSSGLWSHFGRERKNGGECSGDLLELVAACEGWDRRRDWLRILTRAAEIAGVEARPLTSEERAARRVDRARREQERRRAEATEEEQAHAARRLNASVEWRRYTTHHEEGLDYLRSRGLEPRPLIEAGHVRFSCDGDVCVPLWDFGGELCTVVRRVRAPKNPADKVFVARGGTQKGTLLGRIQEIDSHDVVLVEGVMDALTAVQLWPDRLIIGASGAGQLRRVVEHAAPRIREHGSRLWLVPDGDDIGQTCALHAGQAALEAGLVMDRDLLVIDLGHHDLNDAHRAGWKP